VIIFGGKLIGELLKRMDALQADNRLLTEALLRESGKPVIFSKPESVASEGWFDAKPTLKIAGKQ
jgi:hypothetical protein